MAQAQSGSGSTGSTSTTPDTVSAQIWDYLTTNGLDSSAAAGVLGNLAQESSLQTNATNTSSGAYGLAQWLGSRQTALDNYAQQNGESPSDLDAQLGYLMQEINSGQYVDLNYMNTLDPAQAAEYFEQDFEMAGSGADMSARVNYAASYYQEFTGQPAPGGGTVVPVPGGGSATEGSTGGTSLPSGLSGNFITNPGKLVGTILGCLAGGALIVLGIWITLNPFSDLTNAISGAIKSFAKMPTEGLTERIQNAPKNARRRRDERNNKRLLDAAGKESEKVTNIDPRTERENIRLKDTPINF